MALRQLARRLAPSRPAPALSFALQRNYSKVVEGLHYAESHEWVKMDGGVGTVGITDHAQAELGDVVYVELPQVGATVTAGKNFGVVESVKAASDVNSPISGTVVEVNEKLTDSPALINSSPFEDAWIMKVKASNPADLKKLMDAKKYTVFQDAPH